MDRQAEEEAAVFRSFLAAHPSLAVHVVSVLKPDDFPDAIASLSNREEIDFELGEWLDGAQMQRAKKVEQIETAFLESIGEQGANSSQHFRYVMLKLREEAHRFDRRDTEGIRTEMFLFVGEIETRWPTECLWESPHGYPCTDFDKYPCLAKYLASAHFDALSFGLELGERWPPEIPWITFEPPGGSYLGQWARQALREIIDKKIGHYGPFGQRRVRLLIHYGGAAKYNTPYRDLEHETFADIASTAAQWLVSSTLPFEKVYLLNASEPEPQAFEIYPALTRCV